MEFSIHETKDEGAQDPEWWKAASTYSPIVVSFALVFGCLILFVIRFYQMYAETAPGPWGVPLFGYTLFLSREAYRDFEKLSKTYGKMFSLGIGTSHVTILNTYKDIKDAFLRPGGIFHGRELSGPLRDDLGENKMILAVDGKRRQLQKNFLMRAMKDFGLAHSKLEESIQMEAKIIIKELLNKNGHHTNFSPLMRSFTSNVISHLMFGKRFSYKDKNVLQTLDVIDEMTNAFNMISPAFVLAKHLRWLPDKFKGMGVLFQGKKNIYAIVDRVLKDHEKTFDESCMRDIIDVYIREQSIKDKNNPLHDEVVSRPYVRATSLMMFVVGTDTTSTLLNWAFQILAGHPDIQKYLQDEIDNVLDSTLPSIRDLSRMPFAEAVTLELMRFITTVPFTNPHRVTEDTKLNGFRISKDSFVIGNFWAVNHDPELWDEPETFRPQRFLGKDGIIDALREKVLFFSLGKTRCLGEPIARMEFFILFIRIFQNFSLSLPQGEKWTFQPDHFIPVMKKETNILHVSKRN